MRLLKWRTLPPKEVKVGTAEKLTAYLIPRKHFPIWRYLTLMSLLSCAPQEQPQTPDVMALDCYSRVRYPSMLSDVERPHVDDARQQYSADVSKGTLPYGCWAGNKPKCNTECE